MLNYRPKHVWFQKEPECFSLWLVRGDVSIKISRYIYALQGQFSSFKINQGNLFHLILLFSILFCGNREVTLESSLLGLHQMRKRLKRSSRYKNSQELTKICKNRQQLAKTDKNGKNLQKQTKNDNFIFGQKTRCLFGL